MVFYGHEIVKSSLYRGLNAIYVIKSTSVRRGGGYRACVYRDMAVSCTSLKKKKIY